jgi:lipid A 3-O-deacylase
VCLLGLNVRADNLTAVDSFSVGAGRSRDDIDVIRLGVRKDFDCKWLSNRTGWLSVYAEGSLNYWFGGDDDEVVGAALSPVLIYWFGNEESLVRPYIEGGIGIAGISETQIGDRNLSTGFQFEDRLGIGVRMKKVDLNVRYMHYSNCSIKEPNDGIDLVLFTVSYRL